MTPGAYGSVFQQRKACVLDGNAISLIETARPRRVIRRFRVVRAPPGPWLQLAWIDGFEWNRVEVALEGLPAAMLGMRVVHLSDLHLRPVWMPVYDRLIERLRDDPPDLIVITGDFVEHRADHRRTLPTLQRLIRQLRAVHGVYAIVGNHDGDLLRPRLLDLDVNVICGRAARLESPEGALELVGVPSVSRFDLSEKFLGSLPPPQPDVPRVVLTHFPDSMLKLKNLEADIVLAGHTHGGQICLPGGIPLITHDRLPRRMSRGVHHIGEKLLIISRGLGFASMRMRLFCPAEVNRDPAPAATCLN